MMNQSSRKVAVLVGCNYANTENELSGCINDVVGMRETLVKLFGFEESNIELLTDADDGSNNKVMPTAANMRAALNRMIDGAQPGDVLYFHFSGHGTMLDKPSVGDAIVPCDLNVITDVDFREMVNRVPNGASFTILSDSCFSGGLIANGKEQIGPFSSSKDYNSPVINSKPKFIPIESLLQHFQSLTTIDSSDIGPLLVEYFGDDASLKFRLPTAHELNHSNSKSLKLDEGILLSGCQADEFSADMPPNEQRGGKAQGAFTCAVQEVLKGWPIEGLSNRQVVGSTREVVESYNLRNAQHPCLYCSNENVDAIFLGQIVEKASTA